MLLTRISDRKDTLAPAERRVADVVLGRPDWASTASITELARAAEVSEPTVVRFCRAVGLGGVRAFKVALVREVAGLAHIHPALSVSGGGRSASQAVADGLFAALFEARQALDYDAIEAAAAAIAEARRLVLLGFGASGVVAADAQQRFARLGLAAIAASDPHVQVATAATLGPADVVLAISHSGETAELLEACALARRGRARIVAITSPGSSLVALADLAIAVQVAEDTAVQLPMASRLVHQLLLDVVYVGVATRLGPDAVRALSDAKAALAPHKRK